MHTRIAVVCAATLAIAAIGGAAGAQNLIILTPRIGLEEFAGRSTRVTLNLPPGLDGFSIMDGQPLEAAFWLLNENGFAQAGSFEAPIISGDFLYDDKSGATFTVDLGQAIGDGIDLAFANPNAAIVNFGVRTVDGFDFDTTDFDGDNEATDQTALLDIERPELVRAEYSSAQDILRLEFDEPLTTFDPANDFNQTNVQAITRDDLQFDVSNTFDGSEDAPVGPFGARFVQGSGGRVVEFDVQPTTDIQTGRWLRPAWDSFDQPANTFSDVVGNRAAPTAVQIEALGPADGSADLNVDGLVNSQDLAILLGRWGNATGNDPADITGDGRVDSQDLAQMLGQWT